GIVISAKAHGELKGKTDFICDDLGPQSLKNIAEPLRSYAVRTDGQAAPPKRPPAAVRTTAWRTPALAAGLAVAIIGAGLAFLRPWALPPPDPSTLALPLSGERAALVVLPFVNLSEDPGQVWFSDSITEDMTTAFARFPGFLVIARNTAFQYKGKAVDAAQ